VLRAGQREHGKSKVGLVTHNRNRLAATFGGSAQAVCCCAGRKAFVGLDRKSACGRDRVGRFACTEQRARHDGIQPFAREALTESGSIDAPLSGQDAQLIGISRGCFSVTDDD
jgi:hypothetical protein